MNKQRIVRSLAVLAMASASAVTVRAGFDESTGVQRRVGDPSPSARRSNINDYRFQDEQIDIKPGDGLVRVLRTDQKVLVNDYQTAVFPLLHATPREIRNVMRLVTGLEGGRAEVIQDKTTHNNYVQVIAPKFMIPYLQSAIASLDVQWLKEYWDGSSDLYIKLQNRGDAAFVDSIASTYAGDEGFSTVDTTNNALRRLDEEYRISEYKRAIAAIDIPANQVMLDVKIYEISGRNDTKLGLDYIAWKNGPGRNLFNFATAGYSANQRAGGLTSIFDPFLGARAFAPGDTQKVLDVSARESYRAVNYLLPSNFIDFLNAKGKARVISSQSLMVESSKRATLFDRQEVLAFVASGTGQSATPTPTPTASPVGEDTITAASVTSSLSGVLVPHSGHLVKGLDGVYFYDANDNGIRDAGDILLSDAMGESGANNVALRDYDRSLNYEDAGSVGARLSVVPYVGLESMELELSLNVKEENGLTAAKLPIINTRRLRTTVRLMDGQPFVLAGLSTRTKVQTSAKAPWLGSLPILGYVFGGEQNLDRDTDMVITITPHFYVSSQAHIKKPPQVDTAQQIIDGVQPLGLPERHLGYDMWPFCPVELMNGDKTTETSSAN